MAIYHNVTPQPWPELPKRQPAPMLDQATVAMMIIAAMALSTVYTAWRFGRVIVKVARR